MQRLPLVSQLALIVSIILLDDAIQAKDGAYSRLALAKVGLALALVIAAHFAGFQSGVTFMNRQIRPHPSGSGIDARPLSRGAGEGWGEGQRERHPRSALGEICPHFRWPLRLTKETATTLALASACVYELHWWFVSRMTQHTDPHNFWPFGVIAAALMVGIAIGRPSTSRIAFWILAGMIFGVGLSILRTTPPPNIDVLAFHQHAWESLRTTGSPYGGSIPNVYPRHFPYYHPSLVDEQSVHIGFPYPPLSFLLSLPALALGDPRYATLTAWVLSAGAMTVLSPDRKARLAAALWLACPRGLFVVEQCWTEPFLVLLFVLVLLCRERWPRLFGVALGLFLAVKQYAVLIAAGLWLVRPQGKAMRTVIAAIVTGAAVSLPLMLANWPAFWRDAVVCQFLQPFRPDALSFAVALDWHTGALAFVLLVPATVFALLRAPKSTAGAAMAVGLSALTFFAFNKQAFCNYYFFVVGALCAALCAGEGAAV